VFHRTKRRPALIVAEIPGILQQQPAAALEGHLLFPAQPTHFTPPDLFDRFVEVLDDVEPVKQDLRLGRVLSHQIGVGCPQVHADDAQAMAPSGAHFFGKERLHFFLGPGRYAERSKDLGHLLDRRGGGAATLIVTPAGQSLLADTGNPGDRDAQRIYDVATKQAHLKKIDYVLITHFHSDHVGGAPALAKLIPIAGYVDHGNSVETQNPADAQRWGL
jgi:hypothetical protein